LVVKGAAISGTWKELKTGNVGSVRGKVTGDKLALAIRGNTFSASLNIKTSSCRQSILIAPQGLGVKRISIALGKC
ncbi:MAG: hypothetical protein AAFQ90_13140, partial [Pseudomonadota bacterium]